MLTIIIKQLSKVTQCLFYLVVSEWRRLHKCRNVLYQTKDNANGYIGYFKPLLTIHVELCKSQTQCINFCLSTEILSFHETYFLYFFFHVAYIVYLSFQLRKHSCNFVQPRTGHRGVRGRMLDREGGEGCPLLASALNFKDNPLLTLTDIKRLSNSTGANAYFDVICIQHCRNSKICAKISSETSSYVTNDHVQAGKFNGNVKLNGIQP